MYILINVIYNYKLYEILFKIIKFYQEKISLLSKTVKYWRGFQI